MAQQQSFFNTQINSQHFRRYSGSNITSANVGLSKLNELRLQVKKMEGAYRSALSEKTRREKSVRELQKNAQRIRVDFLKIYENKKTQLMNKQKVQNYLVEVKEHSSSVHRKTRHRKLIDQYQLLTTRNEEQDFNQQRQQRNKKEKQKLIKQIKLKNMEAHLFAKEQYAKIKDQKLQQTERTRKIQDIAEMRSHINFAEKVHKEMAIINHYEQLLSQIDDGEVKDLIRPETSPERNIFFITKKMDTKQSRAVQTSHTRRETKL